MATAVVANTTGHADQPGGRENQEEKTCSPFFYAKPAVERPCTTYCFLCGSLASFLVMLIVLIAGGVEVVRYVTDVPFYIYSSTQYKRQTALISAFDVANDRLDGALREREKAEDDFQLKIIYETENGDSLFTSDALAAIQSLEQKIVAVANYVNFCALNYDFDEENPICVRHSSALNFFDPIWWVPALDPPPEPLIPSTYNADLLFNESTIAGFDRNNYYAFADPLNSSVNDVDLSQENIDGIVAYWSGYCSDAAACPDTANVDESPYAIIVEGVEINVTSQFSTFIDTDFGVQDDTVNPTTTALLSVFFFGSPQRDAETGELYEVDTEGMEDQTSELGAFLYGEVSDILEDGIESVKVFWDGSTNGLLDEYREEILGKDTSLVIWSVLFIVIYLMLQLRSWWLGAVGILMILGNFGPALIAYRVLSGYSYFGTLNILAVFLVLGIGADDIFVYSNTWKQISIEKPDLPVLEQMLHSLARGGKAMLVTSTTTTISFLINATSVFPAVESFGIFSALLIISNFLSVISIYPAATMVYEYYMHNGSDRGGHPKNNNCVNATLQCCKAKGDRGYGHRQGADSSEQEDAGAAFFKNKYYPFVHKFRYVLLVIYVAIMAFYCAVGSQLEPDSESPSLLPDDDQYREVRDKIEEYFSHSDITDNIVVQIPFGLVGADRDDCDGDECDPTEPTDYGAPIWDENLSGISNEYTQKWFLDFCEELESGDGATDMRMVYVADDSNPTPVSCPFQGFQEWCVAETGRCIQTHGTLGTDEYIVDADTFDETFFAFLEDDVEVTAGGSPASLGATNYDMWEDYIRFESTGSSSDDAPTLRYITVEALLSTRRDIDFTEGIALYNEWDGFMETWRDLAGTDEYLGVDKTVATAFITDEQTFHWFFLQEKIIFEAFQGIGLSLIFAFLIMCVATSNWLVSVMATFVITSMVGGVVTFTVVNGWKLGVLEAVLFIMVVGFSVDYTVHLSDAYLESKGKTRGDRTKDMLADMGVSIVSGAISTGGAMVPLLFAYIVFFFKFGVTIFFIIIQSVIFSLLFYSAMLDVLGPQEPKWGAKIKVGKRVVVRQEVIAHTVIGREETSNKKSVKHGKITEVNRHAETCTVVIDGYSTHSGTESVVVPMSGVRGAYEAGHLVVVDKCIALFKGCLNRFCGCRKKTLA